MELDRNVKAKMAARLDAYIAQNREISTNLPSALLDRFIFREKALDSSVFSSQKNLSYIGIRYQVVDDFFMFFLWNVIG